MTIVRDNQTTRECYLAIFDVLGFSDIIRNEPLKNASSLLSTLETITRDACGADAGQHLDVRWFQDTILVVTSASRGEDFARIARYASHLVGSAFCEGIYLRGAIAQGEVFVTSTAVVGEPIIRAHSIEQSQEWIGCCVDERCFKDAERETLVPVVKTDLIVPYLVPLKSGPFEGHIAINWPRDLIARVGEDVLCAAWERNFSSRQRTWDIQRKVKNLDDFLTYLVQNRWKPTWRQRKEPESKSHSGQWLYFHNVLRTIDEIDDEIEAERRARDIRPAEIRRHL